MVIIKREIDKELYEKIKQYIKENRPDWDREDEYYVPKIFEDKIFDAADIYGYGVYGATVKEEDDHYSEKDILQIKKDNTKIIITEDLMEKTIQLGFSEKNIISIVPNQILNVFDINIQTIPSYNTNKSFHPKENNWVGYVLDNKETRYYITGDTDLIPESEEVKCDVLFVPIGGTYTMDYKEASSLTNIINPKYVIPIHYGTIVGSKEDAIKFEKLISKGIKCEIML